MYSIVGKRTELGKTAISWAASSPWTLFVLIQSLIVRSAGPEPACETASRKATLQNKQERVKEGYDSRYYRILAHLVKHRKYNTRLGDPAKFGHLSQPSTFFLLFVSTLWLT